MFQHVVRAYQQFTKLARRSIRKSATLDVVALEERAVPAADLVVAIDPPEQVIVAEFSTSVGAPSPDAIVRLDLLPQGSSDVGETDAESDYWWADDELLDTKEESKEQSDEPAVQDDASKDVVVTEEELALAQRIREARLEE